MKRNRRRRNLRTVLRNSVFGSVLRDILKSCEMYYYNVLRSLLRRPTMYFHGIACGHYSRPTLLQKFTSRSADNFISGFSEITKFSPPIPPTPPIIYFWKSRNKFIGRPALSSNNNFFRHFCFPNSPGSTLVFHGIACGSHAATKKFMSRSAINFFSGFPEMTKFSPHSPNN